jgi:hypothetical protein
MAFRQLFCQPSDDLAQPEIEPHEKEFIELPSVTENTTELLRAMPHPTERKKHQ